MTVESKSDIIALKHIGKIVSRILQEMLSTAKPGMSTQELDMVRKRLLAKYGARSAPKITYNFPGYTCISINEEAAHGIPGERIILAGDVLNVDVSAELNGYFADTGGTTVISPTTPLKARLCQATRTALNEAILSARAGQPINTIGGAIQHVAHTNGFKVIENLGSHGVGRALHEKPKFIAGYYDPSDKRILRDGMVISIEPFLSTKNRIVHQAPDGWTLIGERNNFSAQYEHTLIVTRGKPIIVT